MARSVDATLLSFVLVFVFVVVFEMRFGFMFMSGVCGWFVIMTRACPRGVAQGCDAGE